MKKLKGFLSFILYALAVAVGSAYNVLIRGINEK